MRRILLALSVPLFAAAGAAQQPAQPDNTPARGLVFEPVAGAEFFARAEHGVTWRLEGGRLSARRGEAALTLSLLGARAGARLEPREATGGVSHYYFGRDPRQWRSNVPHYRSLLARHVRPGIDLVHHAAGGDFEFDLVVHPGADTRDLRLDVAGARSMRLCDDGAVALGLGDGELLLRAPVVWQERAGGRDPIACRYALAGDDVVFELGDHDPARDLVIDPVVTFATLLGGASDNENATGVAVDHLGNMAVTGTTLSTDFPLLNALPTPAQLGVPMGFVTKYDAAGQLVFSTYIGGNWPGGTTPVDVGFDMDGQVVFGGNTNNPNLPTTGGVIQPVMMGASDWFFATLLAGGSLSWCTYYGGPGGQSNMKALHVIPTQRGAVVGVGTDFLPAMTSAYSTIGNIGVAGVFGGNLLFFSTQVGFSGTPTSIDVTTQGHVCITGTTSGAGLPTTASSFQPGPLGAVDAFVFVFLGYANSLVYCTYLGGTGHDVPTRIRATTGPGAVYCTVAGTTSSNDFPVHNPVQATRAGLADGFVTRLDGLAQGLVFSTYLGGGSDDALTGLDLDSTGASIVGGHSNSSNLPYLGTLKLPFGPSNRNAWFARLDPAGTALTFLTSWGGGGDDWVVDLDVGPDDQITAAGWTATDNFPATTNALPSPTQDAFLVRLDPGTFVSYGAGTAGWWGYIPVLTGGGSDLIGGTARMQIHDGRGQAPGLLWAGFGRTNVPFLNGTLLTQPFTTIPIVLGGPAPNTTGNRGGGYLHLVFPIPNNVALRGIIIDWQAGLADASVAAGWTLTNGVEVTIR